MALTSKEFSKILDQKLTEHQQVLIEAFDEKFERTDKEISDLRKSIDKLTTTLDGFLKRLTDREEEFEMIKSRLRRVEAVIKEKLGVDIDEL